MEGHPGRVSEVFWTADRTYPVSNTSVMDDHMVPEVGLCKFSRTRPVYVNAEPSIKQPLFQSKENHDRHLAQPGNVLRFVLITGPFVLPTARFLHHPFCMMVSGATCDFDLLPVNVASSHD